MRLATTEGTTLELTLATGEVFRLVRQRDAHFSEPAFRSAIPDLKGRTGVKAGPVFLS